MYEMRFMFEQFFFYRSKVELWLLYQPPFSNVLKFFYVLLSLQTDRELSSLLAYLTTATFKPGLEVSLQLKRAWFLLQINIAFCILVPI